MNKVKISVFGDEQLTCFRINEKIVAEIRQDYEFKALWWIRTNGVYTCDSRSYDEAVMLAKTDLYMKLKEWGLQVEFMD